MFNIKELSAFPLKGYLCVLCITTQTS